MKKGFGLTELLLVVIVLCCLLMVLMPKAKKTIKEQHVEQMNVLHQAEQLQQQLNAQQQAREKEMNRIFQTGNSPQLNNRKPNKNRRNYEK